MPFRLARYQVKRFLAGCLAEWLVENSRWFEHTPMPDDMYEFTVKEENVPTIKREFGLTPTDYTATK